MRTNSFQGRALYSASAGRMQKGCWPSNGTAGLFSGCAEYSFISLLWTTHRLWEKL